MCPYLFWRSTIAAWFLLSLAINCASSEPACLLRHIVTSKPPAPLGWGLFQVGKTHSRHALLSRLPKYPPSMLYPKAQSSLPPSYLVCRLDDLCPVGNLCIVALTKGPGACLNSLGVMLQINKDATMLPFSLHETVFPNSSNAVSLSPLRWCHSFSAGFPPPLSRSRSLSPLAAGSFRPIRESLSGKKREEKERSRDAGVKRGRRSTNWSWIRALISGLREQGILAPAMEVLCWKDAKDAGQVTNRKDWL